MIIKFLCCYKQKERKVFELCIIKNEIFCFKNREREHTRKWRTKMESTSFCSHTLGVASITDEKPREGALYLSDIIAPRTLTPLFQFRFNFIAIPLIWIWCKFWHFSIFIVFIFYLYAAIIFHHSLSFLVRLFPFSFFLVCLILFICFFQLDSRLTAKLNHEIAMEFYDSRFVRIFMKESFSLQVFLICSLREKNIFRM